MTRRATKRKGFVSPTGKNASRRARRTFLRMRRSNLDLGPASTRRKDTSRGSTWFLPKSVLQQRQWRWNRIRLLVHAARCVPRSEWVQKVKVESQCPRDVTGREYAGVRVSVRVREYVCVCSMCVCFIGICVSAHTCIDTSCAFGCRPVD